MSYLRTQVSLKFLAAVFISYAGAHTTADKGSPCGNLRWRQRSSILRRISARCPHPEKQRHQAYCIGSGMSVCCRKSCLPAAVACVKPPQVLRRVILVEVSRLTDTALRTLISHVHFATPRPPHVFFGFLTSIQTESIKTRVMLQMLIMMLANVLIV